MRTSQKGIDLIKKFEGCKLKAYKCPGGVLTIGYGHTSKVYKGQIITQEEAELFLREDLIVYENCIKKYVEVNLTQNEFDALVSWTYNLGCGSLKKSTMLWHLNDGKGDLVPIEMQKWNKAGGKVLKGLVRRRKAEADLFTNANERSTP